MLGAFSLRDLAFIAQGKSIIDILISSAIQNYNLWTVASANPNYRPGSTVINVTVNANVGSTSGSTDAFAVPAAFTAGDEIFITNSATIITKGGNGGQGSNGIQWTGQTPGETIPAAAINAQFPISVTNNGTMRVAVVVVELEEHSMVIPEEVVMVEEEEQDLLQDLLV
jgi:hypothetical protein